MDSIAPVPTISGATIVDDSITFAFSAADATPVTFTCTFDGNAAPCTGPTKTYGSLADGAYALKLDATDAAGNTASTTRMVTLAAPGYETRFTYTPDAAIAYDDPMFEFDSPSANATFECSFDGAAFEECESPVSFSALPEGPHSFVARAVGPGSRRDATPARFDFAVDLTPPETILTLAPPLVLTSRDFALGFTANEPATFFCSARRRRDRLRHPVRDDRPRRRRSRRRRSPPSTPPATSTPTPERREFTVFVPLPPAADAAPRSRPRPRSPAR